jgi:predicted negative regulator of RcsB-dependent stress response
MTDHASSTPKPAKGDERNVVAVDPTAPQATLEERLTEIWTENRTFILAGIVLVIVAIIGRYAWDSHVAAKQREIQAAFGLAETAEAKVAFARDYADSPLAGVALVGAADEAYTKAEYSVAGQRYAQAAAVLKDPVILSRARLGEAMCALQGGSTSKGEELLRKVGGDATAAEAIRAEAWYHLAAHLRDTGNVAGAREAIAKVSEVSPRGMWTMRAAGLAAKLPAETAAAAPAATP